MATISGTFAAAGQSATSYGHIADAILGGPFVGTVALEVAIADAAGADKWVPIATATTPGMMTLPNGAIGSASRKWRLNCTAFTSGPVFYQLSAALSEDIVDLV